MGLSQIILEQESLIRLSAFLGVFALVALIEVAAPHRPAPDSEAAA